MTPTEWLTQVIVPVASPLVAAIAIVIAVRAEGHKVREQRLDDRRQRADSIFTDSLYARDLITLLTYQLSSGGMEPAHIAELQETANRIFDKIFSDADTGHRLYGLVRFTGPHNNIFLVLAELRLRIAAIAPGGTLDIFVYFGVTTLLYLYDSDPLRREDMYQELEKVRDSDPAFFENFMITQDTQSLGMQRLTR